MIDCGHCNRVCVVSSEGIYLDLAFWFCACGLCCIRFVSASSGGRYLSTDSNKIDEPFNVEEAETVRVPPPPTEKVWFWGTLHTDLSVKILQRS